MLFRLKLLIIGTLLSINFIMNVSGSENNPQPSSKYSHHFSTMPSIMGLDFFLNGSDSDQGKDEETKSHHQTASLQREWQKKQARVREEQEANAKLIDKLVDDCPLESFKKLMKLRENSLAKQHEEARKKVSEQNAKDEADLANDKKTSEEEKRKLAESTQIGSTRFGKFLLAEFAISSAAYIYLKLRDTEIQKFLRSTKDQVVNNLREKQTRFNKFLNRPIGALTLTSLATLATCGYAWRESIYNTLTGTYTDLKKSLGTTYSSFSNWLPSKRNMLAAASIGVGVGLTYELYKRFYKQSGYAIALKNFNKSLEGSLKAIVAQYPKYIELFQESQNNPLVLLEDHDLNDFDNLPFVKLLDVDQKSLFRKVISEFTKQNYSK